VTDLKDIKAGEYELVSEVWDQPGKQELGQPYQFTRHVKGDIVTLDAAEAKRLYASGAVVRKGEREELAAAAAVAQAQALVALLPDDLREQYAQSGGPDPRVAELEAQLAEALAGKVAAEKAAADAAKGPGQQPAEAPHGNASLEAWSAYATGLGIDVPEGASRDDVKAMVAAKQQS
jgi:hypothetical protein